MTVLVSPKLCVLKEYLTKTGLALCPFSGIVNFPVSKSSVILREMDITCTLKNIKIWIGVCTHEIGWLDGLREKVTFKERYEKGKRSLYLCLHSLVGF